MERITTFSVWFTLLLFLGISIGGGFSEGQQHLTRSSAVVVGTVYCDTCFNGAFSKSPNHLIPGALVAVECIDENSKPSFRQEVKTDEHGEFKAKLPFTVSKHVKKIKRCSVKLLSSSQPYCSIAASATSSSLKRLRSRNHGENTRVFSAGFFTFKPENQPEICSQKPINLRVSKPLLPDPTFPPPIQDPVPNNPSPLPKLPIVPPLPDLPVPLPELPVLPPLLPPGPQKSASFHNKKHDPLDDKKAEVVKPNFFFFPPNPVTPLLPPTPLNPPLISPNPLNPPSIIPPVPLLPTPPTLPVPLPTPPTLPIPLIPSPPSLPIPLPTPPTLPIPLIPSPTVPTLPPVPLIPSPTVPTLPPVPLIPSPTVPTLPPLPIPPLPSVPTLPPVPVITPPSPPPPSFPIPLPLPPINPGVPPAQSSLSSHHHP